MSARFMQHGRVSVLEHSLRVTACCLALAAALHLRVDTRALVRGALLHDYFLYDWHDRDPGHRWHGFRHARTAARNAARDFAISEVERDMILSHMFPLYPHPPCCRESAVLCVADKVCALQETLARR